MSHRMMTWSDAIRKGHARLKKQVVTRPVFGWRPSLESLESRLVLAADTAIAGTIFNDLNGNGAKDAEEDGLSGWTVFLDDNLNGVLDVGEQTAVTNQDGDYLISGITAGNHRIREIVQPGWTPTAPEYVDLNVRSGQEEKARFYNQFTGTPEFGDIAGTVWNDLNGDGVRDFDPDTGAYTDPGVAGITLFLDLDGNGQLNAGEQTAVTDSNGEYLFANVTVDTYLVQVLLPNGWEPTRQASDVQTVDVFSGFTSQADFGIDQAQNITVQGTLWSDINGDGIRDTDPGSGEFTDPALAGWTVFLDDDENGVFSAGDPFAVTDANGFYTIGGAPHGNVDAMVVAPSNWTPTSPFNGVYNLDLLNGQTVAGVDFGYHEQQPAVIIGTLWNDLDGDGIRATDPETGEFTEPPMAGVTVYLDLNNDGSFTADEPVATTDALGQYFFGNLAEGEYTVGEELPSGWEAAPGYGTSQTVFAYWDTYTQVDFGNYVTQPVTITGVVFADVNSDGIRNIDSSTGLYTEPGLAGWTVFVDSNDDGILSAGEVFAISDATGAYTITNAHHGFVTIRQVAQTNWNSTSPISGTYSVELLNGQTLGGIDFGNHPRQDSIIRGTIYADSNKDGSRQSGERGLSGITVYLDLNNDGVLDADEPTTITSTDLFYTPTIDETGTYSFTHLAPGTYQVREVVPADQLPTPESQSTHVVTLTFGEERTGVDSGNVYRPSEIHGVKFEDSNGNHVFDTGELGIAGQTIYIDLNRNNILDSDEPTTVTGEDGSYTFQNVTPDAYVIRQVDSSEYIQSYPNTTDGVLWPTGVSHSASGNVTPGEITLSLAKDQSQHETVSLTLPGSGGITNMVDVFLLFDDTGSFTNNSPIVRAAFPQIIASLQSSLPGIDFGFGVGRFEEYGNFADEYADGRPFILNQPIVASSVSGFQTSIQAALDRMAPGYGGDTPETLIEALYQTVTGAGFDGNNNGTTSDSGAAGLASTQINPGNSGDVPSFSSFTTDPANSVLAPSGNIGGVGFRAGALPIILVATDTGFAFQPYGETSITGVGGLTLPISQLTEASRTTTPFNAGAGIQQTITGLNALGALVIGLGVNTEANLDPRQDLEAIAKLTGAVNNSTTTIANGTADAIAPGDPFYFLINSGFGSTVANGVVNAIQNAATNVAMNITLRASDPTVKIINHTGTVNNVGAGQTATFDVEFVGDGRPHRFDLQFVREGTNVVLGSIPVVIGTPIAGSGYEYEDVEEGEIETEVDFGSQRRVLHTEASGPSSTYRGDDFALVLNSTGPSVGNDDTVEYSIDWNGDGSDVQTISGLPGTTVTHNFDVSGPITIRVSASHPSDGITSLALVNVNVISTELSADTTDPALTNLVWRGTSGADRVQFTQIDATTIQITTLQENGVGVNNVQTFSGVTGRVIALGFAGADTIDASQLTLTSATIDGGADADSILGGAADDIISGGFGNNFINAGEGNNTVYGNGAGDGAEGVTYSNNTIVAGDGDNTIYGNLGGNSKGRGGNNSITVGNGANTIYGNFGGDGGEGGDNVIVAGDGGNTVFGNFGGDGGEGGDNVIKTGSGNDTIIGNFNGNGSSNETGGHNVIVAGGGADIVYSSGVSPGSQKSAGSILIAGLTNLDAAGLIAIRSEWTSTATTYAEKIANITGTGTSTRKNGDYFLQVGTTVLNDSSVDQLFGETGTSQDWFFEDPLLDTLAQVDAGEEVDSLV